MLKGLPGTARQAVPHRWCDSTRGGRSAPLRLRRVAYQRCAQQPRPQCGIRL